MKKYIYSLTIASALFSALSFNNTYAQAVNINPCGTTEKLNEYIKLHPEFVKKMEENEKVTQEYIREHKNQFNKTSTAQQHYIIPIVFHIIHQYGTENISDAQVRDAVRVLNRASQILERRGIESVGQISTEASVEQISQQYERINRSINDMIRADQTLNSLGALFIYQATAGKNLNIGQVHDPVFEAMRQVSRPADQVPNESNVHSAYIKVDEQLSQLLIEKHIKGRRLLLGEGRTIRELLSDVGIIENVIVKQNNKRIGLDTPIKERDMFEVISDKAMVINSDKLFGSSLVKEKNQLTKAVEKNKTGGIDFTPANMNLQTQTNGDGDIKFKLDPAMLQQLQNAPGFVPVIINIQPMTDLKGFLGIKETGSNSFKTG